MVLSIISFSRIYVLSYSSTVRRIQFAVWLPSDCRLEVSNLPFNCRLEVSNLSFDCRLIAVPICRLIFQKVYVLFLSKSLGSQSIGPQKYQFNVRRMQLMVSYTEPRRLPQIFNTWQLELKQSFWKLVVHVRSLRTLSIISIMLTRNLWYQDGFSMKEKQLWLTFHFQTKMNIFQKLFAKS